MEKSHISLSAADRTELEAMLRQSSLRSKVSKRVMALLELDKGKMIEEVRGVSGLSYPPVARLIKHYKESGLACLTDNKQPGRPPLIAGTQRAMITALACGGAPDGYANWSLRLLADKLVELGYCEAISHEKVSQILKKTK